MPMAIVTGLGVTLFIGGSISLVFFLNWTFSVNSVTSDRLPGDTLLFKGLWVWLSLRSSRSFLSYTFLRLADEEELFDLLSSKSAWFCGLNSSTFLSRESMSVYFSKFCMVKRCEFWSSLSVCWRSDNTGPSMNILMSEPDILEVWLSDWNPLSRI